MSKNGKMAGNLRFSAKMFYRDVPSVKVNKKHKKTSEMYCFQLFFIFTHAYRKTAKWRANYVFRQKCSTGTSLQQKSKKKNSKNQKHFFLHTFSIWRPYVRKRRNGTHITLVPTFLLQGRSWDVPVKEFCRYLSLGCLGMSPMYARWFWSQ